MTCAKCGSKEIYMRYHKQGCKDDSCSCATCTHGSHQKRHDEHLHHVCRGCGFDWTTDVLAGAER